MLERSSSFFHETIPDSYENAEDPEPAAIFSLPVSSPPLRSVLNGCNVPHSPNRQPSHVSIESSVNTTPVPLIRDCSTRSFIHFHGKTAGTGLARRWTCSYCKYNYFFMNSYTYHLWKADGTLSSDRNNYRQETICFQWGN